MAAQLATPRFGFDFDNFSRPILRSGFDFLINLEAKVFSMRLKSERNGIFSRFWVRKWRWKLSEILKRMNGMETGQVRECPDLRYTCHLFIVP
jgi:hypothetical protein